MYDDSKFKLLPLSCILKSNISGNYRQLSSYKQYFNALANIFIYIFLYIIILIYYIQIEAKTQ